MRKPNYYTLLGLSPNATQKEIKLAYRKKCKEFHPDISNKCDAHNMFNEVCKAYHILSDKKSRRMYDAELMYEIWKNI